MDTSDAGFSEEGRCFYFAARIREYAIFRESSEALRGKKVDNDLCLKISLLETCCLFQLGAVYTEPITFTDASRYFCSVRHTSISCELRLGQLEIHLFVFPITLKFDNNEGNLFY